MRDNPQASTIKTYMVSVIIMVIMGLVLFLPAGSLKFWQAWIWWSIILVLMLFTTIYFSKKDPGLLSRRMKVKEKEPQPVIVQVLSFLTMLTFIFPGFDYRFHWSAMPVWLVIAADIMVILGYILIIVVFRENSYASTVIQVEKEQQVISTGPYAMVRHPMYTGLLIMMLFTPIALGSYWALIFALLFIPTTVYRIKKEEATLSRELSGYTEYLLKTRYCLIPLVW